MKQVTQRLRDGKIEVLDVPPPLLTPSTLIVDVRASLLSAGTERTKVETARKSLLGKARARPDQVKQVLEKARRDGLSETIQAVRSRLGEPSALGYSAAGVVVAVGERVSDLQPGDLVACGGGDYAVHAEIDRVPANLCVPVPEGLDFAQASFATVGSIALHGVRQADVRLGEHVAVIGLGLVGQLAAQILRASGCTVVGIDLVARARRAGSTVRGAWGIRSLGRADPRRLRRRRHHRGHELLRSGRARRRALPRPRPRRGRRRCRDEGAAGRVLREGARAARVALVRSRPLRPGIRGARARLSGRLRALDGATEHGRVSRARRVRAGRGRSAHQRARTRGPGGGGVRTARGSRALAARHRARVRARPGARPARAGSRGDEDVLGSQPSG